VSALNPGNGWVSRLCHDPRVVVAVLHELRLAIPPIRQASVFAGATQPQHVRGAAATVLL